MAKLRAYKLNGGDMLEFGEIPKERNTESSWSRIRCAELHRDPSIREKQA